MNKKLDLIGVEVAHQMIAIPSDDVVTTNVKPEVSIIPSTKEWFDGIAIYNEEILPVINIPKIISEKAIPSEYQYIVIGANRKPNAFIVVNRIVTTFQASEESVLSADNNEPYIGRHIIAAIHLENMIWQLLDINEFISSKELKEIEI